MPTQSEILDAAARKREGEALMGAIAVHLDTYRKVRGWKSRRVYLTPHEMYTSYLTDQVRVLVSERNPFTHNGDQYPACTIDGARIRLSMVAKQIREWDIKE